MEKELYSIIFKRKSFHIFRDIGNINPDELQSIEEKYNNLTPLINGIQTAIRIVPADQTTCRGFFDKGVCRFPLLVRSRQVFFLL